ncbi:MAG TPA: HAD-IIA family hydrolase [Acidimicrobiales bacterium]|jgi:HAD superfamily hydrolase (TIGR01450 family)|nr:HAD-IIA family hydrolase [Acidimicrobiales bacterium]
MWPPPPQGTWVIDLDGVVWLAGKPIPGVDEAVGRLRGVGVRVLFATNNAAPTRAELHRQLAHCGITADDADLLRSADVAAGMLAPGSTAVMLGSDGLLEALAARGVIVVPEGPADAVVVGLTRDFTYDTLSRAVAAVRGGARFVGTNEDATYPTPEGLVPGAGALLAAVQTASGKAPDVAGKPHRPTADAIEARTTPGDLRVMVGDRPSTDGALAAQLGVPFGLVLSGVTETGEIPPDADPAAVAPDLLRLVRQALDGIT